MTLDRSKKPMPGKEFSFSLPEIKKFKLNNGLLVLFVQKNSLPIIRLNLILNAGSRFDPQNKKGLSNLTAMAIDEGAGNYDALQLSSAFDNLGSTFGVRCGFDNISLSLQTLTENFEKSLELFTAVVTKPHFHKKDFEREKRKLLTKILQIKDDPAQIAGIVFNYLMFGKKDPYASPSFGLSENIENISEKDVKTFYDETFAPLNSALIAVGDSDEEKLREKLNSYFSNWNSTTEQRLFASRPAEKKPQIYLYDKPGSVQSELRIGHVTSKRNEKDFYSKLIFNTILGGNFSSRINLNLREDKGYTYGAYSLFNYLQNAAYFYAETSVGAENTGNALNEILKELTKIRSGVTRKEFEFAKSSAIRKFPSNFETYKQIAANLTTKYVFGLKDNFFNDYLNKVRNVTLDSVNKIAAGFTKPEEMIILIVGDFKSVRNQIGDIGNITLVNLTGEEISEKRF